LGALAGAAALMRPIRQGAADMRPLAPCFLLWQKRAPYQIIDRLGRCYRWIAKPCGAADYAQQKPYGAAFGSEMQPPPKVLSSPAQDRE